MYYITLSHHRSTGFTLIITPNGAYIYGHIGTMVCYMSTLHVKRQRDRRLRVYHRHIHTYTMIPGTATSV